MIKADTATSDESLITTSATGPQRRTMPYAIVTKGNQFCVVTKGTGKEHGCHPSRSAAEKQMKALYANVPDVQAEPAVLSPILMLEATGEGVQILAEGTAENNGVMRLRVPWYVSNSVARIAGFSKKIYFPVGILAETAAAGNRKIAAKSPGMTSYARHSHAVAKDQLPAGDVIALEVEGDRGHAIIDVNSTRWGQDIQALARAKQLRAVSLRTSESGYGVAERKVNGELMLEATSLDLDGIDFAPDGAAMPTYGVEVLAAEAAVEPAPTHSPRRTTSMEDITVDGLRAEHPQVVKEIEDKATAALTAELDALKTDKATLIAAEATRKRDAKVAEIAAAAGKPLEEVTPIFAEATTEQEVALLALPILLEGGAKQVEAKETPEDQLRKLFKDSGRGQAITAEAVAETDKSRELAPGFSVPAN